MALMDAFYIPTEPPVNITEFKTIQHGRDDNLYDLNNPKINTYSFKTVNEAITSVAALTRMYSASDLEQLVDDMARTISSDVVAHINKDDIKDGNFIKVTAVIDIGEQINLLRKYIAPPKSQYPPNLLDIKSACDRIRNGERDNAQYYLYNQDVDMADNIIKTLNKIDIHAEKVTDFKINGHQEDVRPYIMTCQLSPKVWIDALTNKPPAINTKDKLVGNAGGQPNVRNAYMTEAEYNKMVSDQGW